MWLFCFLNAFTFKENACKFDKNASNQYMAYQGYNFQKL